jgi:hypothetical protein
VTELGPLETIDIQIRKEIARQSWANQTIIDGLIDRKTKLVKTLQERQKREIKALQGKIYDYETIYIPGQDDTLEGEEPIDNPSTNQTSLVRYLKSPQANDSEGVREDKRTGGPVGAARNGRGSGSGELIISNRVYEGKQNDYGTNQNLIKTIDYKYVTIGKDKIPKLKYKVTTEMQNGKLVRTVEMYEYNDQGEKLDRVTIKLANNKVVGRPISDREEKLKNQENQEKIDDARAQIQK